MRVEIHCCDCLDLMGTSGDGLVDLTVTSPPYDGLRTYNGYSFDFEKVAAELFRVTKDGGVVVWVVTDQAKNGDESGTSFRQALFFKECGFKLHDTMIYKKRSTGASGNTRTAYLSCWQFMFVLCKGKIGCANLLRDRKNVKQPRKKLETCGSRNKDGSVKPRRVRDRKEYGLRWNVWEYYWGSNVATDKIAFSHPAIFPEKLAEDHILSWSNEGDLVFDPFTGSGTVAKMARKNNRDFIGCAISQEYVDLAKKIIEQ